MQPQAQQVLDNLTIRLYADGADCEQMQALAKLPYVSGFTTNPSFMRQCGVSDYEQFGRQILQALPQYPISLEVFADDMADMLAQARYIASWGDNVNVKIPVTNTHGQFTGSVLQQLAKEGVMLNVTAMMDEQQVQQVAEAIGHESRALLSVFAGRVADSGVDPMPMMRRCADILKDYPKLELLWASTRETLNIFQAQQVGCGVITVPATILNNLPKLGATAKQLSLDTVNKFHADALAAGYRLQTPQRA